MVKRKTMDEPQFSRRVPSQDSFTITVTAEEMEYLHMALHAMQRINQENIGDSKDQTISRNDILEAVGQAREDPITNPQPEPVNLSDVFIAQYVDIQRLLNRLVEMVGYDMAEEG
jgi:hypothetical protein